MENNRRLETRDSKPRYLATAPTFRDKLCAFEIFDVVAVGSFVDDAVEPASNSPALLPMEDTTSRPPLFSGLTCDGARMGK